jgi:hypothetical protein
VLTKSDLVDPDALQGWREWLKTWWGEDDVQIVAARSYDIEMLQAGEYPWQKEAECRQESASTRHP